MSLSELEMQFCALMCMWTSKIIFLILTSSCQLKGSKKRASHNLRTFFYHEKAFLKLRLKSQVAAVESIIIIIEIKREKLCYNCNE